MIRAVPNKNKKTLPVWNGPKSHKNHFSVRWAVSKNHKNVIYLGFITLSDQTLIRGSPAVTGNARRVTDNAETSDLERSRRSASTAFFLFLKFVLQLEL